MIPHTHVWVFNGPSRRFPGGVFSTVERAETWIGRHKLSGVLTAYPLDEGAFDWALAHGVTGLSEAKLVEQANSPDFIASFSCAAQDHIHYENGMRA